MYPPKPIFRAFAALVLLLLFLVFSSCKKENDQEVTVVRNCTGTYLRWNQKDYQVCNLEKVSGFEDGASLKATFKKIKTCQGSANDQIVCKMLYPNDGFIEVLKIK